PGNRRHITSPGQAARVASFFGKPPTGVRMSLLKVRRLVKRYGGLTATDHFDFDVDEGEIHAIIGPNGAGKSTLIAQLAGEVRPDAGELIFDGKNILGERVEQRARRGIARSYQITSVFSEFSALQNVML